MTWLTVDADDTRIPHATEALATLHALRVSRVTRGEVAVVGPWDAQDGPSRPRGVGMDPSATGVQGNEET